MAQHNNDIFEEMRTQREKRKKSMHSMCPVEFPKILLVHLKVES